MFTIIIFIIILSILVLVHEGGHYFTARKTGMKVYEFGIGYPPRAIGFYRDPVTGKRVWVRGKGKSDLKKTVSGQEQEVDEEEEFPATLYSINWLPLGGFVRIKGENGEKSNQNDSFGSKSAGKRILVLSAGVIMNFIFAGIILGFGFMIGLPMDFSNGLDSRATVVEQPSVLVKAVEAGSPADDAGVKFGDKIILIDQIDIATVTDVQNIVKEKG
mgnify:FL=1